MHHTRVFFIACCLSACGAPTAQDGAPSARFDGDRCVAALDAWALRGGLPSALQDPDAPPIGDGSQAEAYHHECFGVPTTQLSVRCEASDARACLLVGLALTDELTGDRAQGRAAFARACAGGERHGCHLEGVAASRAGDVEGATAALSTACEQGLAAACGEWGALTDDGRRVRRACRDGHLPSCETVESASAARRLCYAGVGHACHRAVDAWLRAEEEPFDAREAETMAARACDAGDADLCTGSRAGQLAQRRARRAWRSRCASGDAEGCVASLELADQAGLTAEATQAMARFCAVEGAPAACRAACESRGSALVASLTEACVGGEAEACLRAATMVRAGCGATGGVACVRRYAFAGCAGGDCPEWSALEDRPDDGSESCPLPPTVALRLHDADDLREVAAALEGAVDDRSMSSIRDLTSAAPNVFPAIDRFGRRIAVPEPCAERSEGSIRVLRAANGATVDSLPIWQAPAPGRDRASHVRGVIRPLFAALPRRLEGFRPMRRLAEGDDFRREGRVAVVTHQGARLRVELPRGCERESVRAWLDEASGAVLVEHRACGAVSFQTGRL
ncbi:MAG: hypothetical protein RLO52_03795 [Sandaracinaceae bacterium]